MKTAIHIGNPCVRGGIWGKALALAISAVACASAAVAGRLEWVGASGGTWDTTTQNWQDEDGNPSAWVNGSIAVFGDNGGTSISIPSSLTNSLGGLVFNGTTAPTISGGALSFASQMPIDMQTYKGATISSRMLTPGGFVANFVKPTCIHPGFLECKGAEWDRYKGATNTVWRDCSLEDLEIKSAYIYTFRLAPLFARAYNHEWVNGQLKVQFQYDTKGSEGIYCVIVFFAQDGADVTARISSCGVYKNDRDGNLLQLGDDFTSLSGGSAMVLDGVTTTSGLGVKGGEIVAEPKGTLQVGGAWTTPIGTCVVSNGTLQITGGQRSFDAGDKLTGNGALYIKNTDASKYSVRFTSTFANELTGGLTVDKAYLLLNGNGNFKGNRACGPGCPIRILNGGLVYSYNWAHECFGGNSLSGTTLYIGTNSTLSMKATHRNLSYVDTVVDGGTIKYYDNSAGHARNLTLRNGAQVVESDTATIGGLRFGCYGASTVTPRVRIDGENPVTIASRIRIYKEPNASWSGDTQYTTFDTRTELRLTGGIMNVATDDDASRAGVRVRKCGAAKMILDYSQDDYPANSQRANNIEMCVDRGTLELRKSHAIVSTQALSLAGDGVVSSAENVSTDVAMMTVGGTNALDFAAGSAITCTNLAFSSSAMKLNLTGEVGETTFRVGTRKCLTASQLRQVKINGHPVVQNEDGYVVLSGLAIYVK